MKVLVATARTQGERKNDFMFATEGALVGFPTIECDRESVDARCGCRHSFAGMESGKGSTTAIVTDRPDLDQAALQQAVEASMQRGGWLDLWDNDAEKRLFVDETFEECSTLIVFAERLPVGTVVERRGQHLRKRRPKGP